MNITDVSRNIFLSSGTYKCDYSIVPGYYTFGPNKNLPGFCPKVGACSSNAALWTNQSIRTTFVTNN